MNRLVFGVSARCTRIGVQVHAGQACRQGRLIKDRLTPVAPFPEAARIRIFLVRTASDRLELEVWASFARVLLTASEFFYVE